MHFVLDYMETPAHRQPGELEFKGGEIARPCPREGRFNEHMHKEFTKKSVLSIKPLE